VPDPRLDLDPAAVVARFELAHQVWTELTRSHALIERIRTVRDRVESWAGRVDDEVIQTAAEEVSEALDAIESRLRQTELESSQDMLNLPSKLDNQLVYLVSVVENAPGFPTPASVERFAELTAELNDIAAEFDEVLAGGVTDFEAMLEEAGIPRIGTE